jgi:predicted helicase
MGRADELIAASASWKEFSEHITSLPTDKGKGDVFERLVVLHLMTAPEYRAKLSDVWPLASVPSEIRRQLNLPQRDEGIDLVARTRDGEFWAVQCKFRSERDRPLTRRNLSTFTSLTFVTCRGISLALVAHTSAKPIGKRELMGATVEIGLEQWIGLDGEAWRLIREGLSTRSVKPSARQRRPHQAAAVKAAATHFVAGGADRGRLIMPCGTGKSLTAFWIAEALGARNILVAVPSLALIRQSLRDWTREFLARDIVPEWLCVCSDESVGTLEQDSFVGHPHDLGIPTTTSTDDIAAFLQRPVGRPSIVFTTYQSSARLAEGTRAAGVTFDLMVLDEAHKTVGASSKPFATLLHDNRVRARRRLFMTATERVLRGDSDDVLSMDDERVYGRRFFQLSFREAIRQGIICDYKILTVLVTDARIAELVEENRLIMLDAAAAEVEAQALAAGVVLNRAVREHGIRHAISFHRSIRAAERFREQQDKLNSLPEIETGTLNLHVSSKRSAGERADLLDRFAHHDHALMTNARCLTEGIDIPAVDCVLFADPKQSVVDIVQAAGRALRRHPGKEHGYILLPLVVPSGADLNAFAETTAFRQVARTITALSTQDERIAEQFRAVEYGTQSLGQIVEIEVDVPVGLMLDFREFAGAIRALLWERVGRADRRPFEEARELVHSLGLKSEKEWREYARSGRLPADIPAKPERTYKGEGWAGWGDWLGTRDRRQPPASVSLLRAGAGARSRLGVQVREGMEGVRQVRSAAGRHPG